MFGGKDVLKDRPAHGPARGRGAQVNPANRFEPVSVSVLGEYLDEQLREMPAGRQVATRVFVDTAKTLINPVTAPDVPAAWSINLYRGCEHGCPYCYARPSHENFGLSCGLDFETKIFAKMNAVELARREMSREKWVGEKIMMSGITDTYQPVEKELKLTRGLLELFAECAQPVSIITKNHLVTRDIDILSGMAREGCASVAISLTTMDSALSAKMEPRASSPARRLDAMRKLSAAGIPVAAMTAPIIPGLNDKEIPELLKAAREAGATIAGYTVLHMPWQVKDVFMEWLVREFPERAGKVESLIRQMRGGELSDERHGKRMRGEGQHAQAIRDLHLLWRRKLGFGKGRERKRVAFRRPTDLGGGGQMGLFGRERQVGLFESGAG